MEKLKTLLHIAEELRQFCKENLTLGMKFKLELYLKKVKEITDPLEQSRNALIMELSNGKGSLTGGTQEYTSYAIKWEEMLETEVSFNLEKIIDIKSIEDLNTTFTYPYIFEYLVYETK